MPNVVSRWPSNDGGISPTAKTSSPPGRGVSAANPFRTSAFARPWFGLQIIIARYIYIRENHCSLKLVISDRFNTIRTIKPPITTYDLITKCERAVMIREGP